MNTKLLAVKIGLLASTLAIAAQSHAGRIVVNHDEWGLSDTGYAIAGATNTENYILNVIDFITQGNSAANILIYSNNGLGYGQGSFAATQASSGHTFTYNTGLPFTLANLSTYDAVFLGGSGHSKSDAVLAQYVNNGGGVYLVGGTGTGGPVVEAATWNGFLNTFGLNFGSVYNGIGGNDAITGTHPVLSGVSQLYSDNGNTITLFGANPYASIIETSAGGAGLIGVYDDVTETPEPTMLSLLALGISSLFGFRRNKARA